MEHSLFNVDLDQYIFICDCENVTTGTGKVGQNKYHTFDVHMTIHRSKFLVIKPTRCTDFSNLFLE